MSNWIFLTVANGNDKADVAAVRPEACEKPSLGEGELDVGEQGSDSCSGESCRKSDDLRPVPSVSWKKIDWQRKSLSFISGISGAVNIRH